MASRERRIPVALTIAGSDSGGGAGIAADLKTFAALGVHGTLAITSVTAQNTIGVQAVYDLPAEMVVKQIESVYYDLGVDAAKTGMLSNSSIIEAVARTVERLGFPLVVDPVMVAKSGDPLLREDAIDALREKLIPVAKIVTPNKFEAERLAGVRIDGIEDAKRAARVIVEKLGSEAAIVKGGHLQGPASVDVLYYRGSYRLFEAPRVEGCTHGTGCSFSAAIAAELAKGKDLPNAIETAKKFITMAIDYGFRVGRGHCPVNPTAWLAIPAETWRAVEAVEEAASLLLREESRVSPHIPEVGTNIVQALPYPYARTPRDVVGVEGRIVRLADGRLRKVGPAKPGASSHMARLVLAAMRFDHSVRGAVNLAYSRSLVEAAEDLGLSVVAVDRLREPNDVAGVEGRSMEWIVEKAVEVAGRVPDVIFDRGAVGKEAMVRILGSGAVDAVRKTLKIILNARGGGNV